MEWNGMDSDLSTVGGLDRYKICTTGSCEQFHNESHFRFWNNGERSLVG